MAKEEKLGEDKHIARTSAVATPRPGRTGDPWSPEHQRFAEGNPASARNQEGSEHAEGEPSVPSLLSRQEPGIGEWAKAQPRLPEASRAETGRETGAKSRDVGSECPERHTQPC